MYLHQTCGNGVNYMKLKNAAQPVWVGVGWAKADHLSLCLAQPLPLTPIVQPLTMCTVE